MTQLQEVRLSVDELEALRLADLEGLYQEDAAARMNVSRATFGRIVGSARRKVAEVLVGGHALRIEGGVVETPVSRTFSCPDCSHSWSAPFGTGRPAGCPECGGVDFRRVDAGPGAGQGRRRRGTRGPD